MTPEDWGTDGLVAYIYTSVIIITLIYLYISKCIYIINCQFKCTIIMYFCKAKTENEIEKENQTFTNTEICKVAKNILFSFNQYIQLAEKSLVKFQIHSFVEIQE